MNHLNTVSKMSVVPQAVTTADITSYHFCYIFWFSDTFQVQPWNCRKLYLIGIISSHTRDDSNQKLPVDRKLDIANVTKVKLLILKDIN